MDTITIYFKNRRKPITTDKVNYAFTQDFIAIPTTNYFLPWSQISKIVEVMSPLHVSYSDRNFKDVSITLTNNKELHFKNCLFDFRSGHVIIATISKSTKKDTLIPNYNIKKISVLNSN
jgi:hypothetical protein